MDEHEFSALAHARFASHGLTADGWTFKVSDLPEGYYGFTDFETKTIEFERAHFPVSERNGRELILHEIAHALVGHGEHDLEWWDKLIDIGGRGVWVQPGIKSIGLSISFG